MPLPPYHVEYKAALVMSSESSEERARAEARGSKRKHEEAFLRDTAQQKEAGELQSFLEESVGFSSEKAEQITDWLGVYTIPWLRFMEPGDLEGLGLSDDEKLKLLRLAATAEATVKQMRGESAAAQRRKP
jgi:hypothetical protein